MKKVESNNKGFTLIELLVVIAIMASILVLAITSLNGISKKKKEEAKKKVEDQIILAAKQYFNSNEYLFEWLISADANSFSTILVRTLVNNDYLNTLTDPVTGKKINSCSYVKVSKESQNKYKFKFENNNNKTCSEKKGITYHFPGSVSVDVVPEYECSDDGFTVKRDSDKVWCRGEVKITNQFALTNTTIKKEKINYYINDVEIDDDTEGVTLDKEAYVLKDTNSHNLKKKYSIKFEDVKGNKGSADLYYYIDNIKPIITFGNKSKYVNESNDVEWLNASSGGTASYTLKYSDEHSGVDESISKLKGRKTGEEVKYTTDEIYADNYNVCDEAGNCVSKTAYAKIDKTAPTITYNITAGNASTTSFDEAPWTNRKLEFKVKAVDNISGINTNNDFSSDTISKVYKGQTEDEKTNGTFYIEWQNTKKNSSNKYELTEETAYDIRKSGINYEDDGDVNCSNNNKTCTRINGGLGAIDANRYQLYKACDQAGNCASKTIYAKMDITPPSLTLNVTSKWIDSTTANAKVYNGICKEDNCNYENSKWTNSNIIFNVESKDELSGINTVKEFNDTYGTRSGPNTDNKGLFYIEWDNMPDEGDKTKHYEIKKSGDINSNTYCLGNTCYRTDSGFGALSKDGKRRQTYKVCDNANNCTSKTVYARFDRTPPIIENVYWPRNGNTSYCNGYSNIYTKFIVKDNNGVRNVYHYMSNEEEDLKKPQDSLSYEESGFNSINNGIVKEYDQLKTSKNTFNQAVLTTDKKIATISRYWANTNKPGDSSNANEARRIGCGTVSGNNRVPGTDEVTSYCNFVFAEDLAGNRTSSRICNHYGANKSSSNVLYKNCVRGYDYNNKRCINGETKD